MNEFSHWYYTFDPFLLPGKLTMRDFLRMPDTPLESIANFVIFNDSTRMAVDRLFTSLSMTCLVALTNYI